MKNAADPAEEKFVTDTDGKCRYVNGREHVSFRESLDGSGVKSTSCHLAIGETAVDIVRQGQAAVSFHFEAGKRVPADYETAFGRMKLEIYTEKMEKTVSEEEIAIHLVYVIYAAGMHASDSDVRIRITAE